MSEPHLRRMFSNIMHSHMCSISQLVRVVMHSTKTGVIYQIVFCSCYRDDACNDNSNVPEWQTIAKTVSLSGSAPVQVCGVRRASLNRVEGAFIYDLVGFVNQARIE